MKTDQLELLEKSIICHCFDGKLHEVLAYGIEPNMFIEKDYRKIFSTILENDLAENECDLPSIGSLLSGNVSAIAKAVECTDTHASITNIEYALKLVKNAFKRRVTLHRMYELYQKAIKTSPLDDFDMDSQIASLIEENDVASKNEASDKRLTIKAIEAIEADILKGGVTAIKTGITKLDEYLGGGLTKGKLITIAARPGCGKTALATNIALNAAMDGFRPHYITIEIDDNEIIERLICTHGQINVTNMSARKFSDPEMDRLAYSASIIGKLSISVNSTTEGSWEKALVSMNMAVKYYNVNCIIIDYIQQFHCSGNMTTREEISYMTDQLKKLAQKYKIPIIVIAQLNRDIEKRVVKVPVTSDLKESGSIEEDSDSVILLYRRDNGESDQKQELWARIAKNRRGICGDIELNADLSINKFYSEPPSEWAKRI